MAGSIALNFMEPEHVRVTAAKFQMQLMEQGLSVAGFDQMCQWAAPDMDQATALAHMAMYPLLWDTDMCARPVLFSTKQRCKAKVEEKSFSVTCHRRLSLQQKRTQRVRCGPTAPKSYGLSLVCSHINSHL